jgi:hypothetical protein
VSPPDDNRILSALAAIGLLKNQDGNAKHPSMQPTIVLTPATPTRTQTSVAKIPDTAPRTAQTAHSSTTEKLALGSHNLTSPSRQPLVSARLHTNTTSSNNLVGAARVKVVNEMPADALGIAGSRFASIATTATDTGCPTATQLFGNFSRPAADIAEASTVSSPPVARKQDGSTSSDRCVTPASPSKQDMNQGATIMPGGTWTSRTLGSEQTSTQFTIPPQTEVRQRYWREPIGAAPQAFIQAPMAPDPGYGGYGSVVHEKGPVEFYQAKAGGRSHPNHTPIQKTEGFKGLAASRWAKKQAGNLPEDPAKEEEGKPTEDEAKILDATEKDPKYDNTSGWD